MSYTKITISLAAMALGAAFVAAAAINTDKRDVVPLQWIGIVEVGGENLTLNGTPADIYAQILAINPAYDTELGTRAPGQTGTVSKRDPVNSESISCIYPNVYGSSNREDLDPDIALLYSIGNGACVAPPGRPGAGGCARTTCTGGSASWLCNDVDRTLSVPCRLVADNLNAVAEACDWAVIMPGDYTYIWTQGQIFSFDGTWNVITHGDIC